MCNGRCTLVSSRRMEREMQQQRSLEYPRSGSKCLKFICFFTWHFLLASVLKPVVPTQWRSAPKGRPAFTGNTVHGHEAGAEYIEANGTPVEWQLQTSQQVELASRVFIRFIPFSVASIAITRSQPLAQVSWFNIRLIFNIVFTFFLSLSIANSSFVIQLLPVSKRISACS